MNELTYTVTELTDKELAALVQGSDRVKLVMAPITVSPTTAAVLLGVSRTMIYELMGRADFPSFKAGTRCLIPVRELREWVTAQAGGQREAAPVLAHRSGRAEQSLTGTVSAFSLHGNRRNCQV